MTDTPAPAAPVFNTYREMVDWIGGNLRNESMWGAWTDDGRFSFGDAVVDTDPDDTVARIDATDDYEVGVMAASIASKMVALATLPTDTPDNRNRTQRRAAPVERPAAALWTPSGIPRPAPTRRTGG